jgi:hypothetical protein
MRVHASETVIAAMLVGLFGGVAFGQASGGVKITGRVETNTVMGPSANIASGVGSRAVTSVGSIGPDVKIRGNLDVTVRTGAILSVAPGFANKATTSVGSVHPETVVTGRKNVVVSTGDVINMSTIPGIPSCVVVGSIGRPPGC